MSRIHLTEEEVSDNWFLVLVGNLVTKSSILYSNDLLKIRDHQTWRSNMLERLCQNCGKKEPKVGVNVIRYRGEGGDSVRRHGVWNVYKARIPLENNLNCRRGGNR